MSIVLRAQGTNDAETIDRLRRAVGPKGLERIRSRRVAIIGVGTLGRRIAASLGHKGYHLVLVDHDIVQRANLHQGFRPGDVGQNKALVAARAIVEESPFPITITAIPSAFEDAAGELDDLNPEIVVAVTHDYASRFAVCQHFYHKTPVISAGIGSNLLFGWVFAQEPGQACLKCVLPVEAEGLASCPAGMLSDIAEVTAALVAFAVDSLVLPERTRFWNYRVLSLCGDYEVIRTVERRVGCPLCGLEGI